MYKTCIIITDKNSCKEFKGTRDKDEKPFSNEGRHKEIIHGCYFLFWKPNSFETVIRLEEFYLLPLVYFKEFSITQWAEINMCYGWGH